MSHHSSYISQLFDPKELKEKVEEAWRVLKVHKDIKAIACSGVSGIAFASALSVRSKKPLIVVRKEGESNHSDFIVETNTNLWLEKNKTAEHIFVNYCIVDDLISTGKTVAREIEKIEEGLKQSWNKPRPALIILYHDGDYNPKTEYMGIKIIYV